MALSIEYIALGDLKNYEKNARTHSHEQVDQLVNSINEFGFTNPVLIDENNVLIAGHGRTAAARLLGMDKVPAIRLNGLSEDQKKALRIADNQLALNAGWDLDLLAGEIQDLDIVDFNLSVLGFDDDFLKNLLEIDIEDEEEQELESDENEFQKIFFTLHKEQAQTVNEALELARTNPLSDVGLSDNANSNAIAFICKEWLKRENGIR